jgi:hypothetical protein
MAMEVAIYSDIERKRKAKKKRGAKCSLETEQNPERPSQIGEEVLAVHPEQEPAKRDEVTMKVTRIVPNPRLIQCVYRDESEVERKALVKVGRNQKFVVGMELKALRPSKESEVWGYAGALPRFKGRW